MNLLCIISAVHFDIQIVDIAVSVYSDGDFPAIFFPVQRHVFVLSQGLIFLCHQLLFQLLPYLRDFLVEVVLRPARRCTCSSSCISADSLSCRSPYNRTDDLCCAGILDLLDLADDRLVYSCTNRARSKPRACDLAHDAADDGMNGDFSAAAVVGEVMGEAEGFFAKDFGKFLLLFDLLLVKDALKLVQSVVRITTEGRDVLRGILANADCSQCNGRSCRAVRIALGRHGKAGGEAYGVIDLVLLLLRHLVIAAVVVILGAYALCAVVRFVFKIAERECPRAEAILLRSCFACNGHALEAGVLFDVDVEAAFSCEDACLLSCASVVGEDIPLAYARTMVGLLYFCAPLIRLTSHERSKPADVFFSS